MSERFSAKPSLLSFKLSFFRVLVLRSWEVSSSRPAPAEQLPRQEKQGTKGLPMEGGCRRTANFPLCNSETVGLSAAYTGISIGSACTYNSYRGAQFSAVD